MPNPDIDAAVAEARTLLVDEFFPDTFVLKRDTQVSDSAGGFTTTEATVASGVCRLRGGALQPGERAIADRLAWTIAYAVDLPVDIVIDAKDRLVINSTRTMEIGGVIDTGAWKVKTTAVVREVG